MYAYIYIYTHTHAHTHTYIYSLCRILILEKFHCGVKEKLVVSATQSEFISLSIILDIITKIFQYAFILPRKV